MMWGGKPIEALTDFELKEASERLAAMDSADELAKASQPFKDKMGSRPFPTTNPTFNALKSEIEAEIERRK